MPRIRTLLAVLCLASVPTVGTAAPPDARKPSIVVILADDLGYADVGCHGCKDIPTPHIDALARSGVRCTNGYVSHPFCSPTRAGLLTGRYQHRFGHENNPAYLPNDPNVGLPLDQVTIADVLRKAGYVTGAVGKWHLGAEPRFHPCRRGFDEYFGIIGGGHDYFRAIPGDRREYFIPLQRNEKPVEEKEYLTDAFSREAVAFIRRHKDRPFFLYLAYNAPHTPLQAPADRIAAFAGIAEKKRRTYAAMVNIMDEGIGRVREALRETGREKDTLVFFLSDNGGPSPVPGQTTGTNFSSNLPLRGRKGQVFEGGVRVPFLVSWPGTLPAGATYDEAVSSLDIFATSAAVGGAELPAGLQLDGVDLRTHLKGEGKAPPHGALFWRTGGGRSYAVRAGRYKLVSTDGKTTALFDLDVDLSEKTDCVGAYPPVAARMQEGYQKWNGQMVAPRWESPQPARRAQPKKP